MRAVLVAGGAGDIGRAIVRAACGAGWRVASLDVAPYPDKQDGLCAITVDLSDSDACQNAVRQVASELGRIDCLVNCMGYLSSKELVHTPADEVQRVVAANLLAPIQTTQTVLPFMLDQRNGLVINICSVWALGGGPARSVYASAKHGLLGFSRSLTAELRGTGVTVVALSPGPVNTKMLDHTDLGTHYPPDALLEVDDIAKLVRWVIEAPEELLHGAHIVFGRSQPRMYVN